VTSKGRPSASLRILPVHPSPPHLFPLVLAALGFTLSRSRQVNNPVCHRSGPCHSPDAEDGAPRLTGPGGTAGSLCTALAGDPTLPFPSLLFGRRSEPCGLGSSGCRDPVFTPRGVHGEAQRRGLCFSEDFSEGILLGSDSDRVLKESWCPPDLHRCK